MLSSRWLGNASSYEVRLAAFHAHLARAHLSWLAVNAIMTGPQHKSPLAVRSLLSALVIQMQKMTPISHYCKIRVKLLWFMGAA